MGRSERLGILMALATRLANEGDIAEAARLRRTIDMHLDSLNRCEKDREKAHA